MEITKVQLYISATSMVLYLYYNVLAYFTLASECSCIQAVLYTIASTLHDM